jgi:hypothetical protein
MPSDPAPPDPDAPPHDSPESRTPTEPEETPTDMAYPTELNGQITDAVTEASVMTTGSAPSQAMAQLYQSVAHAAGLAAQNAVAGQQTAATLAQSVLAALVQELSAAPPPRTPAGK